LPSLVVGPVLANVKYLPYSLRIIQSIANRTHTEQMLPDVYYNIVDVRDVARAHILAIEVPQVTEGRYLVTNQSVHSSDIAKAINAKYPGQACFTMVSPNVISKITDYFRSTRAYCHRRSFDWKLSNSKFKRSVKNSLTFHGVEKTIEDCVDSLMEHKRIKVRLEWLQWPAFVVANCYILGFGSLTYCSIMFYATIRAHISSGYTRMLVW